MKLGEKITILRKQSYITQEELALKLNVTRQAISRWEVGASVPELDTLKKIALIFDVSLDYLTNDDYITNDERKEKAKYINYKLAINIIITCLIFGGVCSFSV